MIVVITTVVKHELATGGTESPLSTINLSAPHGRRGSHPARAALLKPAYQGLVPEGQPHVVEPFEEALTPELVNLEGSREALPVPHLTAFEVNCEAVAFDLARSPDEFRDFVVRERDGQHAVLGAVVLEDVGEGWGDDRAEAVVEQRPGRVFARGATTEVAPGQKDARACVPRFVEDEVPTRT